MKTSLGMAKPIAFPLPQHLVRLDAFCLAFEVEHHAMSQGRQRHGLHVLDRSGEAAVEERSNLRREQHGLGTSRRGTEAHEALVQTLRDKKVKFEGPIEYAAPSPIAASIFLQDPQQNTFELSVRRDDRRSSDAPQGHLGLRRIGHVRLEVTDLERARQWYTETLELEPCDQVPGERQLTFAIGETGQLFVLHEVPAMIELAKTGSLKGKAVCVVHQDLK